MICCGILLRANVGIFFVADDVGSSNRVIRIVLLPCFIVRYPQPPRELVSLTGQHVSS